MYLDVVDIVCCIFFNRSTNTKSRKKNQKIIIIIIINSLCVQKSYYYRVGSSSNTCDKSRRAVHIIVIICIHDYTRVTETLYPNGRCARTCIIWGKNFVDTPRAMIDNNILNALHYYIVRYKCYNIIITVCIVLILLCRYMS